MTNGMRNSPLGKLTQLLLAFTCCFHFAKPITIVAIMRVPYHDVMLIDFEVAFNQLGTRTIKLGQKLIDVIEANLKGN